MTAPSNPGDATPGLVNANRATSVPTSETQSNANENDTKYMVYTPWTTSALKGKNFPTVTPKGTEMSEVEMKSAKSAAKAVRVKLRTRKVSGSGS